MSATLSKEEILTLSQLITKLNLSILKLRDSERVADYIQLTKTPPILTESMIFYLIKDKRILNHLNHSRVRHNEKAKKHAGTSAGNTDIIIDLSPMDREYLVEVKGTRNPSNFTQFYEKDIEADCVIWIDLTDTYLGGKSGVKIAIIENPKDSGLQSGKISWGQSAFDDVRMKIIEFESISDLLYED